MLDCDKCPAHEITDNENGREEDCGLGLWNQGRRCNYKTYKSIEKEYNKQCDEEGEFWAKWANSYIKREETNKMEKKIGLNCLIFTNEELIKILKDKEHNLHELLYRWFGDIDISEEKTLYYTEDSAEVREDNYWLVNIKTNRSTTLTNLEVELEEKIKYISEEV